MILFINMQILLRQDNAKVPTTRLLARLIFRSKYKAVGL